MKKLFLFFIAAALIAAFSVPAAAGDAEWNFYGSARFSTFSVDNSEEVAGAPHTPADDDQDTTWAQQGNSRIGANVSAGDVGGRFEYGFDTAGGDNIDLRLLYGTWNFGVGVLTLGQAYTPLDIILSNQVYGSDNDLVAYGTIYEGRQGMIQAKFGGFKVALVEPFANTIGTVTAVGAEVDTTFPKLELAYTFSTDMFKVGVAGGYNTYEVESDAKTYDIDAWVAALWGQVNLGPAYIKASVSQAQNAGAFGMINAGSDDFDFVANKVKDMDTLNYVAVAGVKLSDAFALEGGYGHVENESDVAGEKDDEASSYYVQATIGLAPGVFIVPEIGKLDYDKNHANAKEGDTTYFGAKWQINF